MEQQPHSFDRITPAPVKLGRTPGDHATAAAPDGRRARLPSMVALGILVCVALAVIFILPRWQSGHQLVTTTAAVSVSKPRADAAPAPQPAAATGSAADAERAAARSAAQESLERLRELDPSLKGMGVETWAADGYRSATDQLSAGERAYQSLDYITARNAWQSALAQFEALGQQAEAVFKDSMARGNQALAEGNGSAASGAFQSALLIHPDDAGATHGAERAGKIEQVLGLIAQGNGLAHSGDLAAAVKSYQQARDLDPESTPAQERLQSARRELGAQAFRNAMSAGFAALEAGQLAAARGHFTEASRLEPGAPEAADALRQTETRLTSAGIERRLAAAHAAEQAEDWGTAVAEYEAALKLDANLLAAREGMDQAASRRDLDQQLAQAIARPERLADDSVQEETAALLVRAAAIPFPGENLKRQMVVLSTLQQEARTPVEVTLTSDGETDVTVYRVGKLGRFASKQVTLRPGRYVVTGTRAGYRDVRVEITLAATGALPPVQIQCTERIAAGN